MSLFFRVALASAITAVVATPSSPHRSAPPANHLVHELSPYLQTHSHDPVDWYPWGDLAFSKARREHKPIFLSIGYSTCHWCHVMHSESFEQADIARLLNAAFVNIKVDREERPDVDSHFMAAALLLTGNGGWPLNLVLTPDKQPFFAATYIPPDDRYGREGLRHLVPRLQSVWREHPGDVVAQAAKLAKAMDVEADDGGGGEPGAVSRMRAEEQLFTKYDGVHGGFGGKPKFPAPHQLVFLLDEWQRHHHPRDLAMVTATLEAMRAGGIYDQLGFGFHRYAMDEAWRRPHFEKMLTDQALLALVYLDAYQATHHQAFAQTAREIFAYVARSMTAPEGGFYTAQDADSEGQEGKFYVWTADQIRTTLPQAAVAGFMQSYGVLAGGDPALADGPNVGANVLYRARVPAGQAGQGNGPEVSLSAELQADRTALLAARELRVHPAIDDKVLADGNGLMIAALARGAQVLGDLRYARAAQKAAHFTLSAMRGSEGALYHRYRAHQVAVPAFADDYACLIWGLREVYEATFDPSALQAALTLQRTMNHRFWLASSGKFALTSADAEALGGSRPTTATDDARPSGNAIALANLVALGRLTGNGAFEAQAAQLGKAYAGSIARSPLAYLSLIDAAGLAQDPMGEVVIAGQLGATDTNVMLDAVHGSFLPGLAVLVRPAGRSATVLDRLAPYSRGYRALGGKATAFVCSHGACRQPTVDAKVMMASFRPVRPHGPGQD